MEKSYNQPLKYVPGLTALHRTGFPARLRLQTGRLAPRLTAIW